MNAAQRRKQKRSVKGEAYRALLKAEKNKNQPVDTYEEVLKHLGDMNLKALQKIASED